MPEPQTDQLVLPYGSWASPITAALLVQGAAGVGEIRVDHGAVWWNEQRPSEGGRSQLICVTTDGSRSELFAPYDPSPADAAQRNWNVRTAVMEYGGGAWNVRDGVVVFAEWSDQRLYRVEPDGEPRPLTTEPTVPRGLRWSEPTWLDSDWMVCIRESHESGSLGADGEVVNELVAVPLDGSAAEDPERVKVLVSGPSFVFSPAVRGDLVAWVQWDHPDMPWDRTDLAVGVLQRDDEGAPVALSGSRIVAGGPQESIVQPGFTGDGDLTYCSDRSGWWNPWRITRSDLAGALAAADGSADGHDGSAVATQPVLADGGVEAEIGGPLWVGGLRWWAELAGGSLLVSLTRDGADGLGLIGPDGGLSVLDVPFTEVSQVVSDGSGHGVLVVGASPVSESAPYRLRLASGRPCDDATPQAFELERLREPRDLGLDEEWFSVPSHETFASPIEVAAPLGAGGRRVAHALVYPPTNPHVMGPDDELPPLVVMIHGGPTSAARHRLDLAKQFWTSRGFAVADVNHGGSTGYGRPFRRLLDRQWGVVDVEDAVAAAEFLSSARRVDRERLAIRGGSAGGFTTLAALCFHDTFKAGASHYGVADLALLATETHKFESRYLDGLVGPWPDAAETYAQRSPIHHTDRLDTPLIVLQGSDDEVVPPNQAEMIVAALAERGVPHAYLLFEGEQHGFRQAPNMIRALEAELWFYGRVFGFEPADTIAPVDTARGLSD